MEQIPKMQQGAEKKGLDKIKYGNPGIRTDVWRKMLGLYGEAIGTFIGLNMDIAIQMLNQGVINPVQNFQKSLEQQENKVTGKLNFNKAEEASDGGYKQVKIE